MSQTTSVCFMSHTRHAYVAHIHRDAVRCFLRFQSIVFITISCLFSGGNDSWNSRPQDRYGHEHYRAERPHGPCNYETAGPQELRQRCRFLQTDGTCSDPNNIFSTWKFIQFIVIYFSAKHYRKCCSIHMAKSKDSHGTPRTAVRG